ncbi:LysR family transcriptional regulator [Ramlibacter monticola]|uniref:LysR family transcriptional regulator n=1 Tax=Ramlibacter monticola TaxID=1926872 RepID=A0A937CR58_9BURK|nr:LysR family transcriptional regulator [Ramlibacter monticola]
MNLRFIETFVLAAKLGSFSRTAERMHTTLAAVSSRMQTLEEDLGFPLFERSGRRIRLSPKGREILPAAERLLSAAADFSSRVVSPDRLEGRVRLGVIDTVAATLLPQFLSEVERRYPLVEIDLHSDTSLQIAERMASGDLDMGFLLRGLTIAGARTVPLFTLAMRWVANPALVQANPPTGPAELARYPVLCYPVGSSPYEFTRALFAPYGGPRRLYACNSMTMTMRLVVAGVGVSALPTALLVDELASGQLRLLDVEEPFPPLQMQLAYFEADGQPLHAALAETAVDVTREYWSTVAPEHGSLP